MASSGQSVIMQYRKAIERCQMIIVLMSSAHSQDWGSELFEALKSAGGKAYSNYAVGESVSASNRLTGTQFHMRSCAVSHGSCAVSHAVLCSITWVLCSITWATPSIQSCRLQQRQGGRGYKARHHRGQHPRSAHRDYGGAGSGIDTLCCPPGPRGRCVHAWGAVQGVAANALCGAAAAGVE